MLLALDHILCTVSYHALIESIGQTKDVLW